MKAQSRTNEVSRACRILFGTGVRITPEFLGRLRPSDLRNTYHKRAMEFHPDRAMCLGQDPDRLTEVFKDVSSAYEFLREALATQTISPERPSPARDRTPRRERPTRGTGGSRIGSEDRQASSLDHFWQSSIPDVKLLFGQYLYYAGVISWRTLILALTWQRKQRPRFGRIAVLWDYLDEAEVATILTSRLPCEHLGDAALRMGHMTPFQRNAVLGFQRWLQRPLGTYFTDRGLLLEEEVDYLARLMRRHNASIPCRRRCA